MSTKIMLRARTDGVQPKDLIINRREQDWEMDWGFK